MFFLDKAHLISSMIYIMLSAVPAVPNGSKLILQARVDEKVLKAVLSNMRNLGLRKMKQLHNATDRTFPPPEMKGS